MAVTAIERRVCAANPTFSPTHEHIRAMIEALQSERLALCDEISIFIDSHTRADGVVQFGTAVDWACDYLERLERIDTALAPFVRPIPMDAFRAAVAREAGASVGAAS